LKPSANLLVPGSIERQLIVGEHVGPFLRGRRSTRRQGTLVSREAQQRLRAVPGQYAVVGVDQHWIDKAKLSIARAS
jgi:hypothetical protein